MLKKKLFLSFVLVLIFLILFPIVSVIFPPLFQKTVAPELAQQPPAYPPDLGPANERVLSLDDNTQALQWRLRVIEAAKEDLIFTTYQFGDDDSGQEIMSALLAASERGVKVRILLDGISGYLDLGKSRHFHALAASPNVEVKIYNPVNLLVPWRLNYRMHDKYLAADDTAYILGGRNTQDVSLGNYQEYQNFDRDMLVYSPVPDSRTSLSQVKAYFESIWSASYAKPMSHPDTPEEACIRDLHQCYESLQARYPDAFEKTDWEGSTLATGGVRLLTNSPRPNNKEPIVWHQVLKLMEQGRRCLVQTPYIICNQAMYGDLARLNNKDIRVQILTNAVANGANVVGCSDYMNEKQNILKTGAEIFEYQGPHSSHTKTVLIDDRYSIVGSFNFDMRSAYIDTETMLVIDCPRLNAHLKELTGQDMESSLRVFPDGTEIPGDRYYEVVLPPEKVSFYRFLRIVAPPIRHLF